MQNINDGGNARDGVKFTPSVIATSRCVDIGIRIIQRLLRLPVCSTKSIPKQRKRTEATSKIHLYFSPLRAIASTPPHLPKMTRGQLFNYRYGHLQMSKPRKPSQLHRRHNLCNSKLNQTLPYVISIGSLRQLATCNLMF